MDKMNYVSICEPDYRKKSDILSNYYYYYCAFHLVRGLNFSRFLQKYWTQ